MTSSILRGPNAYMLILFYISVTSPCRKLEYAILPLSQRAPISPLGIKLLNINRGVFYMFYNTHGLENGLVFFGSALPPLKTQQNPNLVFLSTWLNKQKFCHTSHWTVVQFDMAVDVTYIRQSKMFPMGIITLKISKTLKKIIIKKQPLQIKHVCFRPLEI